MDDIEILNNKVNELDKHVATNLRTIAILIEEVNKLKGAKNEIIN